MAQSAYITGFKLQQRDSSTGDLLLAATFLLVDTATGDSEEASTEIVALDPTAPQGWSAAMDAAVSDRATALGYTVAAQHVRRL
jgi:hypothetical protein